MFREQIKNYEHNKYMQNADCVLEILEATEKFITYTNRDPACTEPEILGRVRGTKNLVNFIFDTVGNIT